MDAIYKSQHEQDVLLPLPLVLPSYLATLFLGTEKTAAICCRAAVQRPRHGISYLPPVETRVFVSDLDQRPR